MDDTQIFYLIFQCKIYMIKMEINKVESLEKMNQDKENLPIHYLIN